MFATCQVVVARLFCRKRRLAVSNRARRCRNNRDRNPRRRITLPRRCGCRAVRDIRRRETCADRVLRPRVEDNTKAVSFRGGRAYEENHFLRDQIPSAPREEVFLRRDDMLPARKANRSASPEAMSFPAMAAEVLLFEWALRPPANRTGPRRPVYRCFRQNLRCRPTVA